MFETGHRQVWFLNIEFFDAKICSLYNSLYLHQKILIRESFSQKNNSTNFTTCRRQ